MHYSAFCTNGDIRNEFMVRKTQPHQWSVADDHGCGVRTHDGFAVFETKQQAEWCAELMNTGFNEGRRAAQRDMLTALGLDS